MSSKLVFWLPDEPSSLPIPLAFEDRPLEGERSIGNFLAASCPFGLMNPPALQMSLTSELSLPDGPSTVRGSNGGVGLIGGQGPVSLPLRSIRRSTSSTTSSIGYVCNF